MLCHVYDSRHEDDEGLNVVKPGGTAPWDHHRPLAFVRIRALRGAFSRLSSPRGVFLLHHQEGVESGPVTDPVQGHGLEGSPADLAPSQRSATSARSVSIGPRTWKCPVSSTSSCGNVPIMQEGHTCLINIHRKCPSIDTEIVLRQKYIFLIVDCQC